MNAAVGSRIKQAFMAVGRKITQRAGGKSDETVETAIDLGKQVYDKAKKTVRQQGASSSRSSTVARQPPLNVDVGAHPSRRWKATSCFLGERSIGGELAAQHNHARAAHNLCGFDKAVHSNFMDYLFGFCGFDLNLMVAVDFTDSNGDSGLKSSLHFHHPSGLLNPYQQTIKRVGGPIQMAASDNLFYAWGFGGVLVNDPEQNDEVSHSFNLNGMHQVFGVDGILSAYAIASRDVAQSRPLQLSAIVNRAVDIASEGGRKYRVLLIITTGVPTDLPATVDALVRGAELPLSVLVVSLGDTDLAEFENEVLAQELPRQHFVRFGSLRDVFGG